MHRLELVAVRVAHEGGVVVRRVVAQARRARVAAALGEGGGVEGVDRLPARRDEGDVGAVAGALAGARWGLNSIPESLSSRLQSRHPNFLDEYPQALIGLADALLDINA